MQWWSIDSALVVMEPEATPSYRSDNTGRSETRSTVLERAYLNMGLPKVVYTVMQVNSLSSFTAKSSA